MAVSVLRLSYHLSNYSFSNFHVRKTTFKSISYSTDSVTD